MLRVMIEIIVTGPKVWAEKFLPQLVARRSIACVHFQEINSHYWWDGKIERAVEIRASLHATDERSAAIVDEIKLGHPYKVPCILVFKVDDANPEYAQWVRSTTA